MVSTQNQAQKLLKVIGELLRELNKEHLPEQITLDSSFESDLGLDSLSRVELVARVESAFNLTLPQLAYAQAQSPRDLLRMLGASNTTASEQNLEMASITLGESEGNPYEAKTLVEVLEWHVAHHPERPHIQLYQDEGEAQPITYAMLYEGAKGVATLLQEHGLESGGAVVIMLPSSQEYFFSFLGILMAGGIPVPIYPPARPSQLEDHMRRHSQILQNCDARILITVPEGKRVAQLLQSLVPNLESILSTSDFQDSTTDTLFPAISPNDIAFLQYTSGSTGNPKGVMLTHANLLANIRSMGKSVKANSKDVFVSWLPLYHDMGLIGAWLSSLYFSALFVVMSPLDFLSRPQRWLWAIHRYRGTLSASPNFGYEYTTHRLKESNLEGLDLSSWRGAFNGAEAVSPETIELFCKRFEPFGFDSKSMMPVYGLAESSVGLVFPPLNRGIKIDSIDRDTFTRTGEAKAVAKDAPNVLRFISSGMPLVGHEIRVVDESGHELPERQEGRLEFRGPSSTSGYYRDNEKTKKLFDGEWLDSGDKAYIANGELYITGRIKDIIIRAGRNIYPDELEKMVGNIQGVRKGCVAVFASIDKTKQTEKLVVLAETKSQDTKEHQELRRAINQLSIDLTGVPPDEIVLAPVGSVLKTSSGKIRRLASREHYEKGLVSHKPRSVAWQAIRLALSGIKPLLRRSKEYISRVAFATYSWSVFVLIAPVAWLSMMLLPKLSWRWGMVQRCLKFLAFVTATPLKIKGVENLLPKGTPSIVVVNHSSYLDSMVLMATLSSRFSFIAKAELKKHPSIRIALERINTQFVERFDMSQSLEDTKHLTGLLQRGHSLILFPEGTFSRVSGLMPFKLGAFSMAAKANVPVVPIAIRGTRSILRDKSWFPHRGSISIEIGKAIDPKDIAIKSDNLEWERAIELRDQARAFILKHCGEPDLG